MALGANTQRPSGGFFIINRRRQDANSGILGLLTSVNSAPVLADCRQHWDQSPKVLVMLDHLPKWPKQLWVPHEHVLGDCSIDGEATPISLGACPSSALGSRTAVGSLSMHELLHMS